MEGRITLINAAITLVLMAILAIAAFIFKIRGSDQPEKRDPIDPNPDPVAGFDSGSGLMNGGGGHLQGNEFPSFLPHCDLVENRANDGDSFRVRYSGQERVFDLYLADAPEISLSYGAKLTEQAEYFDGVSEETVIRIGEEAKAYALNLLRNCEFTVFTSWEQVPGTPRFFAFVVVEHHPGKRCFLSELLVLHGFAKPVDRLVTMPAGASDFESFRRNMASYELRARREKQGGWGIVAGRLPTRRALPAVVPASG